MRAQRIAALVGGLAMAAGATTAGDPIPGIDRELEQIPGGLAAGRQLDDDADCLAIAGARVVVVNGKRYCRLPEAISHNSSRSNFSRTTDPAGGGGGDANSGTAKK